MSIKKDLGELQTAGVISKDVAERIQAYYQEKKSPSANRLILVFGILGAILVGLGIILIIAHNWDELTRSMKTIIAFLPLLLSYLAAAFIILKNGSRVWREGVASFWFFATGACLALISQIYHLPGELDDFLFSWSLLTLPILYIMRSSAASLLYIALITYFACEANYFHFAQANDYGYWFLFAGAVPWYIWSVRKWPENNFTRFHHWFISVSLVIVLGTLAQTYDLVMYLAYTALFALYTLAGQHHYLKREGKNWNVYSFLGSSGIVILLLMLSFRWFWVDLSYAEWHFSQLWTSPEVISVIVLTIAIGVIYFLGNRHEFNLIPEFFVYPLFFMLFIFQPGIAVSVWIMNILTLMLGLTIIYTASQQNLLIRLNYGLLVVAALTICRFFDGDLSFVVRGLLFLFVGAGFFLANYYMLKRRKQS